MRIVVIGATGNVGSAIVRALAADESVTSVVAVARRTSSASTMFAGAGAAKVSVHAVDVSKDRLDIVAGADVVIHVAWKLQPQHDEAELLRTNVLGTRRVVDAVLTHGVPALVVASSVGTYAPGVPTMRVDESWPATGIATSTYSRHKVAVEAMLDTVERLAPELRIVRMRTSLVFQRAAASEIHRIFLGPLLPWRLPQPLRLIPDLEGLAFQATHADDVADAYRRAALRDVRGPFNIASEPALTPALIAEAVGGRVVPFSTAALRLAARVTFALRVQPSEPGWLDLAVKLPLLNCSRAELELDWSARITATTALTDVLGGMGDGAGGTTVPLHPRAQD